VPGLHAATPNARARLSPFVAFMLPPPDPS
jgi:hypothetical protein